MKTNKCNFLFILLLFVIATTGITAQSKKLSAEKKIEALEKKIKQMSDRITLLEAIISPTAKNQNSSIAALHFNYVMANRDGIINDMNNLAANSYQYKIRPTTMGGGGGSYIGYSIPKKLQANDNGSYAVTANGDSLVFVGTSRSNLGTITATMNETGRLHSFIFTGDFE